VKIESFSSFMSRFYLVKYKNKIYLIDTGTPWDIKKIKTINNTPSLVLITHAHWDHIGCAYYFKERNIKVFVSEEDSYIIKKGIIDLPPSKGTIYANTCYILLSFFKKFVSINRFVPDVKLESNDFKIVKTPGHTEGSVTYIFEDKFFIGDSLIGPNRILKKPRCSLYVRDKKKLLDTFEFFLSLDGTFYPGHGKEFNSDLLRKSKDVIYMELRRK